MDLQTVRVIACEIALKAGETLMRHYRQPHAELTKKNAFDIVTESDKAVEAVIIAALCEAFPDHPIVSEEGGGSDAAAEQADYLWFIDPIDGTTNFAHDLPLFAISIGMADRQRTPLVGVVYNPVYGELFSAARGFGATLNGEPLHVAATADLSQSILISGFSTDVEKAMVNMREWIKFMPRVRGLRRFGSAALDLCYVASGWADAFWEPDLNAWDIMAGLLMVEEAGGRTTDYSGGAANLYNGREVLASNGALHEAILQVLHEAE